jgi:hypothetical protein
MDPLRIERGLLRRCLNRSPESFEPKCLTVRIACTINGMLVRLRCRYVRLGGSSHRASRFCYALAFQWTRAESNRANPCGRSPRAKAQERAPGFGAVRAWLVRGEPYPCRFIEPRLRVSCAAGLPREVQNGIESSSRSPLPSNMPVFDCCGDPKMSSPAPLGVCAAPANFDVEPSSSKRFT